MIDRRLVGALLLVGGFGTGVAGNACGAVIRDAFEAIYRNGAWGKNERDAGMSGSGSS